MWRVSAKLDTRADSALILPCAMLGRFLLVTRKVINVESCNFPRELPVGFIVIWNWILGNIIIAVKERVLYFTPLF